MAIKLKQYLENSWYRGASQDRQTGYAAQFQYGENINIRDMKNGVCLSGGSTDITGTFDYRFSYFTYDRDLYTVDREGIIRDEEGETVYDLSSEFGTLTIDPPQGIQFGDDMYIISGLGIYKIDSGGIKTDITPSSDPARPLLITNTCVINYANTFLIIGINNQVWRYDGITFKLIREFDSSYFVFGFTQEGNYLKIYTSDLIDTKIHYAKGTFDVEYTGLVQTVSFKGLSINNGCVTSDQGTDYALFAFSVGDSTELKLGKISGYNKTDIRWTQTWAGKRIFTSSSVPYITANDGVVFAATDEGIWTFTEYNGWLWGGCVEFKEDKHITCIFRYGERLYACIKNGNNGYIMRYYDLSFHPAKYQSSGFIIGRVFDGGCAGLFKKNDQATITYNMPEGTSMELSYRYDRSSFGYDKSDFISIKKLTDVNNCYDIVVPTTPGTADDSVLLLQNNDKILLENGNGIKLEDMLVCPFNKTWNLLEYRFDLTTTNTTKTPILFEHSLTYYDYMRKYR